MIDLTARRDLGQILNDAFRLYRGHFKLFSALAFGVIVPADLFITGVGLGALWSGYDLNSAGTGSRSGISFAFLLSPLVTAMHIGAVMRISQGERPGIGAMFREGFARFAPVMGALILYALGVVGGLLLLVIPGIYFGVAWSLYAQGVVVEGRSPSQALGRSRELVSGSWWRVFGILIVMALVAAAMGIATLPILGLAAALDSGAVALVGTMISDSIGISFAALTSTLLYFDLRARREGLAPAGAPPAAPPDPQLERPEAPPGAVPPAPPEPVGDHGFLPPQPPPPVAPPPPQIFDPPRD